MKTVFAVTFAAIIVVMSAQAEDHGTKAPDFPVRTDSARSWTLEDYRGHVVILDFWASWCKPCRKEMPYLVELHSEFERDSLVIIAVNLDKDRKKADRFLARIEGEVPFTIVHDPTHQIPPKYEVAGMPTTILIDRNGEIRYRHTGFSESHKESYRLELKELLRGGSHVSNP